MEVIKLDDFPINPIQDQIYEIIPDKTKIVASTNRLFNKYPTRYMVSGVEEELLVQPTRRASIVKRHNEVRMRCFLYFAMAE